MKNFDATVDFSDVSELTVELTKHVNDGEFTVVVVPADSEEGFIYAGDEEIPDSGDDSDWVVTGKTAHELALKLSALV